MIELERTPFAGLETEGPIVKICGLMTTEHAVHAAETGADLVGFVFAPSKRHVTPELAREVVTSLRARGLRPLTVGVFVNETPARIREIAGYVGLDVVQLSGDEPYTDVWECMQHSPVLKAIRFPEGTAYEDARRKLR